MAVSRAASPRWRLEQLEPRYACEFVGLVLKTFPSSYNYTELYVTDYTSHPKLREMGVEDGPYGRMTLRIEAMHPHKAVLDHTSHIGKVVYVRNLNVKLNRAGQELEATLWPDKQDLGRINISCLSSSDPLHKEIMDRKHDFNNPKGRNNKKRKRKQELAQAEAQLAAEQDDALRKPNSLAKAPESQPLRASAQSNTEPATHLPNNTSVQWARDQIDIHLSGLRDLLSRMPMPQKAQVTQDLKDRLGAFALSLPARSPDDLNAPSPPDPRADLNLRPLRPEQVVYLEPKTVPDDLEQLEILRRFHDIPTAKLDQPWQLTDDEKQLIQYPEGYEPVFPTPSSPFNTNIRLTTPLAKRPCHPADIAYLTSPTPHLLDHPLQAALHITDFHPPDISRFATRLATPHHAGDRLEFWLRGTLTATSAPLSIWVPHASAQQLLGTTATHILDGRDAGVARLRARLRELWGDLELVKHAFAAARGGDGGVVRATSRAVVLGLRKCAVSASSLEDPWAEEGADGGGRYRLMLEDTEIAWDDDDNNAAVE